MEIQTQFLSKPTQTSPIIDCFTFQAHDKVQYFLNCLKTRNVSQTNGLEEKVVSQKQQGKRFDTDEQKRLPDLNRKYLIDSYVPVISKKKNLGVREQKYSKYDTKSAIEIKFKQEGIVGSKSQVLKVSQKAVLKSTNYA